MVQIFVVADPSADAAWGIRRHLQALVSRPGHEGRGDTDGGI